MTPTAPTLPMVRGHRVAAALRRLSIAAAVAGAVLVAWPRAGAAQPAAGAASGSSTGSADPGAGSAAGSADVDAGAGSAAGSGDPGAGSATGSADPADPGAGSAGAGSGAGSSGSAGAGSGSGSAGAGSGSGSAGAGSGSGAAGAGSGSGAAKRLQLPLDAGAPTVSAAASPSVVRLGGRLTLYITATFSPGVEVNLREPVDLGPAFEIRRKLSEDRRMADGRTTREWQLDVTPWELGDLQIAPLAVTFTMLGRAGQIETNAVPLKILGELGDVVDDPRAMRGLAAPTGLRTRDWFWIWVAAAGAAVIGVVLTALWLRGVRRRRRRGRALVGTAIARPPRIDMTSERALERLLEIEQSGVLARAADRKLGYAQVVEVVRGYLGARYAIGVRDLTSSELLARLAAAAPADAVALVTGWLAGCDLVKYGGHRATAADAGQVLDDARALIVATTPADAGRRPGARAAGKVAA